MRSLSFFVCFLISFTSYSQDLFTWSESTCSSENSIFEGATRDYYNRGARLEWQNKGGDWIDDFFREQGRRPFSKLKLEPNSSTVFSANTTNLVNLWISKTITNHGFYIKPVSRNSIQFFSKESHALKGAQLILKTQDGISRIPVDSDIEIDLSTYTCKGQYETIQGTNPFLLKFDLSSIKKDVISASLEVYSKPTAIKGLDFSIFAVSVPKFIQPPRKGFSNTPGIRNSIKNDYRVYYSNDFSSGSEQDISELWRTNQRVINVNEVENFEPLFGDTLEVTIQKGKFLGASKRFSLKHLNLEQAFFRYHLRLGNSWEVNTGGKLPGFSGTHANTSMAAGWGGRKSNGSNGWSARGAFGVTTSKLNTIPNRTPLGVYLYHADMKYVWGDSIGFNLSHHGMLEKNKWYSVEQFIKLNEPNKNNGILQAWVNGHLVMSKSNIRFTDDPRLGIEDIWFNVYHGGKSSAHKDLTLFFDDLIVASEYIGSPLIDL